MGLAGGAALVSIGYLDRVQHAGHAWRAVSVRLETRLPINRAEEEHMDRDKFDYHGRVLPYIETLLLLARTGYQPAQTRRLLVGRTAACAALTAVVVVRAAVQACLLSAAHNATEDEDHRDEGTAASGELWISVLVSAALCLPREMHRPADLATRIPDVDFG